MAITYVNDLRLSEMDTGDNSGTWGTVTNTNLELIGEALGYGTEAITTNADTHASTIADGSTDPVRAMYVKYTGTLDSACTITIGPNTVNKFYYIENATSGSQNIIISQGSGANVTIPPGDVKAVYLDGAGSGAAVTDAFASLNVVDLKVQDDLTVTDDLIVGGDIDLEGSIDVNGTANLDAVDIGGALTMSGGGDGALNFSTASSVKILDNNAASLVIEEADNAYMTFVTTNSSEGVTIHKALTQDGGATFNNAGANTNFVVKSDNNATMFKVDGNDNVLVGHDTSVSFSSEAHELQVSDTNFSVASFATYRNGSDGAGISLGHSRNGTLGGQTVVNDNDFLGLIQFFGSDGTDFARGASIGARVNGTPGNNDMPSELVFSTSADDSDAPTERLVINSTGHSLHTVASQGSAFVPDTPSTWNALEIFQDRGVTNSASGIAFRSQSGTAPAGIVSVAGNTTGGIEALALMTSSGNNTFERMRIDENGNVGINTSSQSSYLATKLVIGCNDEQGMTLAALSSSTKQNIYFADGTSGSARNRGNISYDHNIDELSMGTSSGSQRFIMDSTGAVTMPSQPAFSVNKGGTNQNNLAVGSDVTVTFDTERFDNNSDFNLGANSFTAPVTGKYQFSLTIRLENLDSAAAYYIPMISTSNTVYRFIFDPDFGQDTPFWSVTISVLADMDASDTAHISFNQGAGTAQTDVSGDDDYTYFTGYLVC
jgi:hypothetical protein